MITGGLTFVLRSQANVEADAERLAELFAERAFDFYRRQGWIDEAPEAAMQQRAEGERKANPR